MVPPNGAAQNRLAKARLKTGGGPAARPADRPGGMVPPDWAARGMVPPGMVPPIGGTVPGGTGNGAGQLPGTKYGAARLGGTGNGACNCRHGIWCRLRPARFLAARFLAARFWAAGNGTADWRTVLAGRQIGIGDSPAGNAEPGNADVLEHAGVRGCGCPGACGALECGIRGLPAGPIGPAGMVPGNCPARSMVPPDWAAQNGAAFWQHLPPPDSAAAGRAAGRSAGGRRGGGA